MRIKQILFINFLLIFLRKAINLNCRVHQQWRAICVAGQDTQHLFSIDKLIQVLLKIECYQLIQILEFSSASRVRNFIVVTTEYTVALVQSLAVYATSLTNCCQWILSSQLAHAKFHVARFVPLSLIIDKLIQVLLKIECYWQLIQILEFLHICQEWCVRFRSCIVSNR